MRCHKTRNKIKSNIIRIKSEEKKSTYPIATPSRKGKEATMKACRRLWMLCIVTASFSSFLHDQWLHDWCLLLVLMLLKQERQKYQANTGMSKHMLDQKAQANSLLLHLTGIQLNLYGSFKGWGVERFGGMMRDKGGGGGTCACQHTERHIKDLVPLICVACGGIYFKWIDLGRD